MNPMNLHLKFTPGGTLLAVRYCAGDEASAVSRPWKSVDTSSQVVVNIAWLAVAVLASTSTTISRPSGGPLDSLKGLRRGKWFEELFGCKVSDLLLVETQGNQNQLRAHFVSTLPVARLRAFVQADGVERDWLNEELPALQEMIEKTIAVRPKKGRPKSSAKPIPAEDDRIRLNAPLRIHVLLGSDELPYTANIRDALKAELRRVIDNRDYDRLIVDDAVSLPGDPAWAGRACQKVEEFLSREERNAANYWVCIGSPAVVALRAGVKGQFKVPLLAVGVTNPARLGLPTHQGHKEAVGVIRYGQGLHVYPDILLKHVFAGTPEGTPRLAFAYHTGVEHEVAAMWELDGLPITRGRDPQLKLVPFEGTPTIPDLWRMCEERVVWGWYALEHLMKSAAAVASLRDTTFVSTVTEYARDRLTAVAIQPDDVEIGKRAAGLLLADRAAGGGGRTFGQSGVVSVREHYWIHRPTLNRWVSALKWTWKPPDTYATDPLCAGEFLDDG